MKDIEKFLVKNICSIKDAVRIMDHAGYGFCACINSDKKVIGVLTDGDFRRAVLNGTNLEDEVENIINRQYMSVTIAYEIEEIKEIFSGSKIKHIPVIENGELVDIIFDDHDLIKSNLKKPKSIDKSVLIMAGGKGERLDPFTRVLPKPLIPIGDEPIIKIIIDEFSKYSIKDYLISINANGKMIRAYFFEHTLPQKISFIEEDKPLGTAGSIKLAKNNLSDTFFVTNCDILIKTDYSELLEYHCSGNYSLTLVASLKHYVIPYGVCDINEDGSLIGVNEKPEYDYLVNAGLYVLDKSVLDLIPDDTYFDMTDLIKLLQKKGMSIGVFPVSDSSWNDIGQWPEYKATIKKLT